MLITAELKRAIATNKERDAIYKDGYKAHAKVLEALFPQGLPHKTPKDWERTTMIMMITAKLVRYGAHLGESGKGHLDSLHDLGVYAFMLEKLERDFNEG